MEEGTDRAAEIGGQNSDDVKHPAPEVDYQARYDEIFERIVEDLLDEYESDTTLEESAIFNVALVLWKRINGGNNRFLDSQVTTALTHIARSKAVRKKNREPLQRALGVTVNICRNNGVSASVTPAKQFRRRSRHRSAREILTRWAPHGVVNSFKQDAGVQKDRMRVFTLLSKRARTINEETELQHLIVRMPLVTEERTYKLILAGATLK